MHIPQNEQDIIISACCFAYDHYACPYVYSKTALEKECIEYTAVHDMFIDWYLGTWDGKD